MGRRRGGYASKLHLVTERSGNPIVVALTAGQRHERPRATPLLEDALDRLWPEAVARDKGYRATETRQWLEDHEIAAAIPYRANEARDQAFYEDAYREWPVIERTINGLKRFRRVAPRYEKTVRSYLAMVTMAMIPEWI